TRSRVGALADSHRGNERIVRADEGIVADHGLRLVHAVIVAGDGTGPDIDPGADLGVAEVTEVAGFRARADLGFLHLDEIAQMDIRPQFGAATDAGEGSDAGALPDSDVLDVAEGADFDA